MNYQELIEERDQLVDQFEAKRDAVKTATSEAEVARQAVLAFDKKNGTLVPPDSK